MNLLNQEDEDAIPKHEEIDDAYRSVDNTCGFTAEMIPALEAAAEHPDMTEELTEVLSTSTVKLEYRVESGVRIEK